MIKVDTLPVDRDGGWRSKREATTRLAWKVEGGRHGAGCGDVDLLQGKIATDRAISTLERPSEGGAPARTGPLRNGREPLLGVRLCSGKGARSAQLQRMHADSRGICPCAFACGSRLHARGKKAVKWPGPSCLAFRVNAVRLQLHTLAYSLANFLVRPPGMARC